MVPIGRRSPDDHDHNQNEAEQEVPETLVKLHLLPVLQAERGGRGGRGGREGEGGREGGNGHSKKWKHVPITFSVLLPYHCTSLTHSGSQPPSLAPSFLTSLSFSSPLPHLQAQFLGVVDLHKHPHGEGQGSNDGKDESVGKMIVHRQLHVVLAQMKSLTDRH